MGWWSTTLWMARKYRWRRPCKLVTSWCIPSLKGSSMRAGLAKLTHDIIKLYKEESWRSRRRTPARRSRRPMILTEVIMMSRNSMVSSSWLPLPSTRWLTTKPHDLNVFRHVESIKKTLMSTTITTAYHILVEEKFNQTKTHPVKHVSSLPGVLLQVILPVHSVDDH